MLLLHNDTWYKNNHAYEIAHCSTPLCPLVPRPTQCPIWAKILTIMFLVVDVRLRPQQRQQHKSSWPRRQCACDPKVSWAPFIYYIWYITVFISCSTDAYQGENINNGRFYRHSFSYAPKRQRHQSRDDRDRESRLRCHGEDEATLRQLLLEYVASVEQKKNTHTLKGAVMQAKWTHNEHQLQQQQQQTVVFLAVQLSSLCVI